MAEALGVAASGIAVAQIAIQVGGAVVKLKQLWDEVKNVPDDIADLMDQIDCLDPILWEAENGFSRCDSPSMLWDDLASKSMTVYCRKALQNLTGIVDELNHQITNAKKGRRKITAVKVLLKKDSIQKLQKRLENAVQMLILAQQSYLVALQRVQPDIIIQKFTALTALTAPQTQSGSQLIPYSTSKNEAQIALTEYHEEADISRTATKPQWVHSTGWIMPCYFGRVCIESFGSSRKFLFQSPLWLSQRSWELHSNKALGAWKWNLKSYRVVPSNSKIIKLAQKGSPKDIQKLFDAGLASPYDRDERGWTLLHVSFTHVDYFHHRISWLISWLLQYAVAWSNFEMTKYLMAIGVSPREPDDMRCILVIRWNTDDWRYLVEKQNNYLAFAVEPFNLMIMEWLKALALAGVDLEAYGRREYAILLDDYSLRYIVAYSHSYSGILRLKIYLIRFKFGPKPEDWEFYFNEPTDEFAGDFWKLVEDPPLRIPGAWVEDDGC
ncbi:hypothetical protein Daesc_009048 [Daldinia eschscholtzii]|uniref:NACHT-NTPase and P-loop NTPases N-terminal domain-containing protein n=1 Tax=Daldinia eschscholtzii TaxID=292717 RepID=A0AAX6M986_9PEZI